MSMHLINGVSVTHRTKQKKLTKTKIRELEQEHKQYNKEKKQSHRRHEMMTFDEFVDYKFGKKPKKAKSEFKELKMDRPEYRRTEVKRLDHRSVGPTGKSEPQKYTGTLVKGVSQMHKSNLVPVINEEEIHSIARMRR